MEPATQTPMGYRATQDDGQLVVHDVPIFLTCKRGEAVFDDTWISAAVSKARQAANDGYYPPLHIRHHDDKETPVRAAGYFQINRAAPITYKGKRRMAILADLIITDPLTQEEVLAKRLPYRSVEIFNVDEPNIDSLALLDHEAPFLELPMLMVSEVEGVPGTFARPWQIDATTDGPMVACFRRGDRASLLFREEGMENELKDADEPKQANFAEDGDDKKKDDKKKDGEEMQDESSVDTAAIVKAITSGSIPLKDFDDIRAAIAEYESSATSEPEEPEEAAPAPVPGESMEKESGDAVKFAKLETEIELLRVKEAERDAAETRTKEVGAAMKRLADRPMGADLEGRLMAYHKTHGSAAFKDHVEVIAQAVGVLPADDGGGGFSGAKAPPLAMKFMDCGGDAVDKAAAFCAQWEELRERGLKVTREAFVRDQMRRAGFELAETA
jgi:hypothetical protein